MTKEHPIFKELLVLIETIGGGLFHLQTIGEDGKFSLGKLFSLIHRENPQLASFFCDETDSQELKDLRARIRNRIYKWRSDPTRVLSYKKKLTNLKVTAHPQTKAIFAEAEMAASAKTATDSSSSIAALKSVTMGGPPVDTPRRDVTPMQDVIGLDKRLRACLDDLSPASRANFLLQQQKNEMTDRRLRDEQERTDRRLRDEQERTDKRLRDEHERTDKRLREEKTKDCVVEIFREHTKLARHVSGRLGAIEPPKNATSAHSGGNPYTPQATIAHSNAVRPLSAAQPRQLDFEPQQNEAQVSVGPLLPLAAPPNRGNQVDSSRSQ